MGSKKYSDTGLLLSHFPDTLDEGWEESRSEGERPQNFRIFSKKIFPKRGNSKNIKICDRCLVCTAIMDGQKIIHNDEIFYAVMMISGNITLSDGSGTLGENLSLGE